MNPFSEAGERDGERDPSQPTLDLQVEPTRTGLVVHLAGDLDVENSSRFHDVLMGTIPDYEGREVELDLSRLTFLDVAGVRALVRVHDRVTSAGGSVRVLGLDDNRLPAAQVLGLSQYLGARAAGGGPESGSSGLGT